LAAFYCANQDNYGPSKESAELGNAGFGAINWRAGRRAGQLGDGTEGAMDIFLRLVADPGAWAALATLIAMEVVLGLDNLVFIALLSNRIDERRRGLARGLGLSLALLFRLALLASASWAVRLTASLATVFGHAFSARDALLLVGGLFLVWKATTEIHHRVDPDDESDGAKTPSPLSLAAGLIQIILIDIVFSVDSIITAVGMTDHFPIMVAAVVVSVGAMMAASGPLGAFIHRNPTVLMLALSFLLMIGMTLIADGFGFHIERGYIYAAMFFSSLVEALNALARRKVRRGP
jgi:predicted tellurium resistance membrane protein TerC